VTAVGDGTTGRGEPVESFDGPDPRRWFTLAIVILSVLIVALDTTVLNVAIPTILRDLDTTLPSLQWVIAGYSLTFASLLIIGGRWPTSTARAACSSSAPRCSESVRCWLLSRSRCRS
jgi:MFS family permease